VALAKETPITSALSSKQGLISNIVPDQLIRHSDNSGGPHLLTDHRWVGGGGVVGGRRWVGGGGRPCGPARLVGPLQFNGNPA